MRIVVTKIHVRTSIPAARDATAKCEWVRATRRAKRAAQDHPAELAYLWNLCRSRGEHGLDTKPPRAGKREGNDFAHLSASLRGMDEAALREPEEPFDVDVSRDGHDSLLRPSLLQGFGRESVGQSLRQFATVVPDWAPCLRSDVG